MFQLCHTVLDIFLQQSTSPGSVGYTSACGVHRSANYFVAIWYEVYSNPIINRIVIMWTLKVLLCQMTWGRLHVCVVLSGAGQVVSERYYHMSNWLRLAHFIMKFIVLFALFIV